MSILKTSGVTLNDLTFNRIEVTIDLRLEALFRASEPHPYLLGLDICSSSLPVVPALQELPFIWIVRHWIIENTVQWIYGSIIYDIKIVQRFRSAVKRVTKRIDSRCLPPFDILEHKSYIIWHIRQLFILNGVRTNKFCLRSIDIILESVRGSIASLESSGNQIYD